MRSGLVSGRSYDIELTFDSASAARAQGPIDVLVIDQAERPTAN